MNDILQQAFLAAGIPSRLEPSGPIGAESRSPDCVTMVPWSVGKCLCWDFSLVLLVQLWPWLKTVKLTSTLSFLHLISSPQYLLRLWVRLARNLFVFKRSRY